MNVADNCPAYFKPMSTALIAECRAKELGSLLMLLNRLEAEFLHEATRVMSGSKAISDSLADMQSTLLLASAKIAKRPR